MSLNPEQVGWLLKMIQHTREVELSCPECAATFDLYAQKLLDGAPIDGVLTQVKAHLDACSPCADEFRLILDTIAAIDEDNPETT